MCGIAGLVSLNSAQVADDSVSVVTAMCDIQMHRGPDDRGTAQLGRAVLGSNRLSIIDLSEAGHMPMCNPATDRWIAFNGEVYNFMELRNELEACGHEFNSRTDTEVVLHAYEEWGEAALNRFVGMFGFAIYDRKADRLLLARDRYGKKPVYYAQHNGQLLFASEIKALVRVLDDVRPNRERLMEWSLYRNVDFGRPETLFEGILSLPAGYLLEVQQGKVHVPRPYYVLEDQVNRHSYERLRTQSPATLASDLESLVTRGIRDRLVSDVPVGTLCSGGLDSSLITAITAQDRKDLLAFNVSVTGHGAEDESRYAKQVTDSLGVELLTLEANGENFRENLARTIYHSDHPLTHPNSVFFLLISEFARGHGVKVLLSGEAADELFGGYVHRYRRYRQYKRLQAVLARLPAKVRRVIALAGYASENVPVTEFTGYDGLLAHSMVFIDRCARLELRQRCNEAFSFVSDDLDRGVLAGMLADLTNFLAPLLRRLDRMSMAASVECRVPFLDHRLVHTAVNLPMAYRLRGGTDKWILKEVASRHLPREIVYRKKVGFPLPLEDYLAPVATGRIFEDGFCVGCLGMHPSGVSQLVSGWRSNVNGFFNLLSLEIWGRLFFLGESIDDVSERFLRVPRKTPVV